MSNPSRPRNRSQHIKQIASGIPHIIQYGQNYRSGTKAFIWMFDNLGGSQIKYCGLTAEGPKKVKDKQALERGFDFIKENSPRDETDNKKEHMNNKKKAEKDKHEGEEEEEE